MTDAMLPTSRVPGPRSATSIGPISTTSVSPGIGSPNTTMPPMIVDTLAAVEVEAMTGTASPSCSERAEA